jgi:FkbM family methyltransferase
MAQGPNSRAHFCYRAISSPLIGYPLLLCWQRGWLPKPQAEATARLRDGRLLRCDLSDRTQRTMYLGLFEPSETVLVARHLRPGDIFIDIGAHIGWFTTLAADRVGATGRVVACEPYPANAASLRENLTRNCCRNVELIDTALGSRTGTVTLGRGGGDSGAVTAVDWDRDRRVDVRMATLDDIAAGLGTIALMKVDVEGWEAQILQGAAKTLLRTKCVLIEINPPALAKAGTSPDELIALLQEAGFVNFVPIAETGWRRLHRNTVHNVLAIRPDSL